MKKSLIFGMTVLFTVSVMNGKPFYADKEQGNENKNVATTEKPALLNPDGKSVSYASKENFEATYGKISDVMWTRGKTYDEATFSKDGKKFTAFFDDNGTLVGTTNECSFSELPAKGQKEIKSKYKDYTVGKVIFFDDNKFQESEMLLYGLQFKDKDNYFVEVSKGTRNMVLKVDTAGFVEFYANM
jgi:hypothetical protein